MNRDRIIYWEDYHKRLTEELSIYDIRFLDPETYSHNDLKNALDNLKLMKEEINNRDRDEDIIKEHANTCKYYIKSLEMTFNPSL